MTRNSRAIRVRGLVRLMNNVRDALSTGLSPAKMSALREAVVQGLRAVEEGCKQHHTTVDRLPTPSRRAYQFLKSVDLSRIPIVAEGASLASVPLHLTGLVKLCDQVQAELLDLARAPSADRESALLRRLAQYVEGIVRACERAGGTPAGLPLPSRRAFQMLSILADADHLAGHLGALRGVLERIRRWNLLAGLAPRRPEQPLRIEFLPASVLYQRKVGASGVLLRYQEAFIAAPDPVWDALVRLSFAKPKPEDRAVVSDYATSDDFADLQEELEMATLDTEPRTQGAVYDLSDVFARVNAEYFEGRLSTPRLVWSRTPTSWKLGHYHLVTDTIMVSLSLDDPRVPPYVIESVVYHEALHKELGIRIANGRRQAHTAEFRSRERRFRDFERAQTYLQDLVSRSRAERS